VIPYFQQPSLSLGPLTIHGFGVLVACAVMLGVSILHRRAPLYGLTANDISRFVNWVLVCGFIGAHLVDRFVYFPAQTLADPISIFRVWEGLSSFGGFLGGTVGALWFFRKYAPPASAFKFLDAYAYAFPFAWIFGRLGCFIAFDHPGRPTTFFLGQAYKDGVVRHNLGLDEALYTMLIAGLFYLLGRRPRFVGFFLGMFVILYAPFRFGVDFLRTVDVRYFGLTPGQYGSIALLIIGVVTLWVRGRGAPAQAGARAQPGDAPPRTRVRR
jgi:phosphatidylglycerol:prolipoprotein diacylglycerol transferase